MTDRVFALYLGTKFTGITVRPDAKYPSMYRVHWADRPPSDMVNLARARDAAMRWVGREGGETAKRLKWGAPKSAAQRATARLLLSGLPDSFDQWKASQTVPETVEEP
jgi:hypothetical protein